MTSSSHKSKQYLLVALKVLILGATFYYIYHKFSEQTSEALKNFIGNIGVAKASNLWSILIFGALACCNWFFEILKWKNIVRPLRSISFGEALKQSLYAHTVSLATPNRIGDYGAKAFFYPKEQRKPILVFNFFNNSAQMLVTTVLGCIGLIIVIATYELELSTINLILLSAVVLLLFFASYLLKEKQLLVKGLSIQKVLQKFNHLSTAIKSRMIVYSVIRYALFSSLFYLLLRFFSAEISSETAFPIIFAMYFLVSVIPSVFIFDVVVRGGVAVWLFSFANVNELAVLSTVLIMWLLNFVLPAILGSYFLFSYAPKKS